VKTGIANWEYTEVLEGLQEGEKIVTALEKEGVKAGVRAVVDDKPAKK
jgi:HlyD family secretion protein